MKNTDITKIRQLLKEALTEFQKLALSKFAHRAVNKIHEALALLPCETCNGTGKKMSTDLYGGPFSKYVPCPTCEAAHTTSCPDCQKKPCKRCGGINGNHKQVDDPQAGNSHMLTKMQCPLDPKNPTYY